MTRGDPALVLPGLRGRELATAPVAVYPSVLLVDPATGRCPAPVGSDAWLGLLRTGAIEGDAEAIR